MAKKPSAKEELRGQLIQKQAEDEVASTTSWGEVIKYLFFLVILCLVVLNQVKINNAFEIGSAISEALRVGDDLSFDEIYAPADAHHWLLHEMLPTLVKNSSDVPDDISDSTMKRRLTNFNRIMSPIRLVQKRMKMKDNPSSAFKDFEPRVWAGTQLDMYGKSKDESTDNYGPWLLFSFEADSGAHGEGGYSQIIFLDNIDQTKRDLTFLVDNLWIDRQTNILYVDFTAYNGHFNVMTYITAQFTITNSGYIQKELSVVPLRLELYLTFEDYLRLGGEIIYLIMTILYTAIELYQIKLIVAAKTLEFKSKALAVHTKGFKMLKEAIKTYFADGWNYLDALSLIFSYIAISLWVQYIMSPLVGKGETPTDWNLTNKMVTLYLIYRNYIRISAISFFLMFLRLIKYLAIFERVRVLHITLMNSWSQVMYFLALMISVFMSFVIYGHIAFGTDSVLFSSFWDSIVECLLIFFGDFEGLTELRKLIPGLFLLYFIPYTVLMVLILTNMFIAIISGAYRESLDLVESRRKVELELRPHFTYRVLRWFKSFVKRLKIMFKRDEQAIQKYIEAEKQTRLEENQQEGHGDYNEDFTTYIRFTEHIEKDINTGKEIAKKTVLIKRNKERELIRALRFIAFVGLFIGVVLWQQEINTSFSLRNAVREEIEKVEFESDQDYTYIYDYDTFYGWMEHLYEAFKVDYNDQRFYVANRLFIFGQGSNKASIRVNIRRIKLHSNDSERYADYEPRVRNPIGFDPSESHAKDENTDDLVAANGAVITHSSSKGYGNAGGFLLYFTPIQQYFLEEYGEFKEMQLLGIDTNSVVIDFVLYNKDLNYFVYTAIVFLFRGGGRIEKRLEITPLKFQHYTTPNDLARAVFEILFLLSLFVSIFFRIFAIRKKWQNYNIWMKKKYETMNPLQIRKRNRVKPEWIRKLQAMIGPFVFLELVAFLLAIVCAIMWIVVICIDDSDTGIEPDSVKFFDVFATYTSIRHAYFIMTSVTALLFCLRLMKYLQLNQALSLLSDTLSIAAVDILYFLMIMVSVLVGFVFMAYLSFGPTLERYSSFGNAFLYSFEAITGSFDYQELRKIDPVMAPLYFFLLSLLFAFVLLNIFIAILEKAYSTARAKYALDEELQVTFLETMWTFCLRLFRKKSQVTEKEINRFRLVTDFGFGRMTSGLHDHMDEKEWATVYAEQIMFEQNKRKDMQIDLEDSTKERRQEEMYRPSVSGSRMGRREHLTREQYWNYLRAGYRHFQYQESRIYRDTEKTKDQELKMEQEFARQKDVNSTLADEIKAIELELDEISTKLTATEEMINVKQMAIAKKTGRR